MNPTQAYGKTRIRRPDVSYAQIEAAASSILLRGDRPTADCVREALKGGAQRTLLNGLQRFWKELGGRLAGVPDTRRRLPAAVAELAESIWEKALEVALESAQGADQKLKNELAALRTDNETRGHALNQREIEMESLVRSRERTIRELEEHLRATMALVSKRDATIRSLETRLAASLTDSEGYRQRLSAVVTRAVARQPPAQRPKPRRSPTVRSGRLVTKSQARPKVRGNSQKQPRRAAATGNHREMARPRRRGR